MKTLTTEQRLQKIYRHKEVLDLRGLLMHSYHGSHDSNAFLGSDGKTLIKRAGHGIEAFIERYLKQIFERTAPIDVIAVLEGGNDLRTAIYPTYKAKRKIEKEAQDPKLTEELKNLQEHAVRILSYLGCTIMEVPKVEADDAIAMICHRWPGQVLVHTRDADLAQLAVLENTTVFLGEQVVADTITEQHNDKSTFELDVKHIALFKSLVGDKSDEYGGVPGFGTKAWEYLVETYGDEGLAEFEALVRDDQEAVLRETIETYGDPKKVLGKMLEHFKQWRLCYRLATLHPAWCWMARAGQLIRPKYLKRLPLAHKLREALDKANLGALYDDLKQWVNTEYLLEDVPSLEHVVRRCKEKIDESPVVGFDLESYDVNQFPGFAIANKGKDYVDQLSQEMTGASFTFGSNLQHSIYVPVNHADTACVDKSVIADLLTYARQKQEKLVVAHNGRFEHQVVERDLGINLNDLEDTITLTSYFDENLMEGVSTAGRLKELSKLLLNYTQVEYSQVLEACKATDMRGVSGREVLHYGCDDAFTCAHLWVLMTLSVTLEGQMEFIEENDILVGEELNRSYAQGIAIDFDEVALQGKDDAAKVESGMLRLRELLSTHATDISREEAERRGRELLVADEEFHEANIRSKNHGIGSEKIAAEKKTRAFKYADAVTYKPMTTRKVEVTFAPTKIQMLEVARILGLPKGEEFEMETVSAKQLTQWLVSLNDWMHNRDDIEFEPEIEDFAALLGGCMHQMAKRDGAEFQKFSAFCAEILGRNAKEITEGDELNLDSPNQCQELLYLKLGLPVRVRSKVQRGSFRDQNRLAGSPATNDKAMQMAIAEDCPDGDWRREFLRTLLEVKSASTRIELYWEPYPNWKRPTTGCVHGQIKNNGTVTRRPTGGQPNLLQVSKGLVRKMVVPRYQDISIGGKYNRQVTISIDFSGQELRITGSEAKDPSFIEAYTGGGSYKDEFGMTRQIVKDVHSVTGCMFAYEVLRRELNETMLAALELDEFGRMSYGQFRSLIEDGVLALSQLDLAPEAAETIVKAVGKVRKMAKAVNFLICYLGQPSTLAGNIGIPKAFAESIMAAVFKAYGRLAPWQEETIATARKQGFVTTAYGTWKHVSVDILSKDGGKRSRAERQAVNQTIQGCLQAGSLVHTDAGLRPIETLLGQTFSVNTGAGWHLATALNMGRSQAVRVTLSSGLVVNCDVRHKLKGSDLQWKSVVDMEVGQDVALPTLESSQFSTDSYQVTWPFVVGYWLGDGCLHTRKGSRPTDTHTRSTVTLVGGKTKKPVLEAILGFLQAEGISANWGICPEIETRSEKYTVSVNCKDDIEVFRELEVSELKALEKRVPTWVMEAGAVVKEEFLRGFLLADGARNANMRVHTPNHELLLDLQRLAASIDLDTVKKLTAEAGYVEFRRPDRNQRKYPFEQLRASLEAAGVFDIPTRRGDCEAIAERRALQRGSATQRLAERMLSKYGKASEVYRYDQIEKIEVLDYEVDTFTLSVDHPLHQYVADGVIHQNCAADILKVVLTNANKQGIFADPHKAVMYAPVYDEILASVHMDYAFEYVEKMQDIMNLTPPGHAIPMMGEVSVGMNWYEQVELGDRPAEQKLITLFDKWVKEAA